MARIVFVVYARIYAVFGSGIMPGSLNHNKNDVVRGIFRPKFENCCCRVEHRELYQANLCLFDQNDESLKKRAKTGLIRFHKGEELECGGKGENNNQVLRLAPPSTVGGAGLSLRYANVILLTERCMHVAAGIGDDVRVVLYDMLPGRLKVKLRAKLRSEWLKWKSLEGGEEGHSAVVARWHGVLEEVMEWLLPVAHDMVRWQAERNLEKQKFETRPTVLLLQTLHYSDLEKVEEAIVEVLVGLSCVYWHRKQQ